MVLRSRLACVAEIAAGPGGPPGFLIAGYGRVGIILRCGQPAVSAALAEPGGELGRWF